MQIFANKHFSHKKASLFSFFINMAIYFRATMAIGVRIIKFIFFPLVDIVAIYGGFLLLVPRWGNLHGSHYPKELFYYLIPIYILIWLVTCYLSGSYDTPVKLRNVVKGILTGTILILILYSLLNEDFRFSRMLIFIGTAWTLLVLILVRFLYHSIRLFGFSLYTKKQKQIAIVGEYTKSKKIEDFINNFYGNTKIIGYISTEAENRKSKILGNLSQLREIVQVNKITELIFSTSSLSAAEIIQQMIQTANLQINFKIASPDGLAVIGSNSIKTNGELYVVDLNSVMMPKNKRLKRLFDLTTTITLFIFSPLILIFVKNGFAIYKILGTVLSGKKSWIGYYKQKQQDNLPYPTLKEGVLPPVDIPIIKELPESAIEKINLSYSQNYSMLNDLSLLIKNFKFIFSD